MSKEITEILRPYRCFIKQEAETVAAIKALIESKCKEAFKAGQCCETGDLIDYINDTDYNNWRNAPSPTNKKR